MLKKYLRVWYLMSRNAFASAFHSRLSFSIFLFGKMLRFVLFTLFLFFLVKGTKDLAGYTLEQTIFIFLTFNVIDVFGQFFFREVYRFKPLIINGSFDMILVKPVNSLFRSLMGGADFIDLVTIPLLIFFVILIGAKLNPGFPEVALYLLLVINGLVITAAFYILSLALMVRFLDLDYVHWLYRDLLNLGKLPVEIYKEPLRSLLIYFVPVATMITIPARAMMGLISVGGVLISLGIGTMAILIAIRFWEYALKYYTSASS